MGTLLNLLMSQMVQRRKLGAKDGQWLVQVTQQVPERSFSSLPASQTMFTVTAGV